MHTPTDKYRAQARNTFHQFAAFAH